MKRCLIIVVLGILVSSCTLYQINSNETDSDYYPSKASLQEVTYLEQVDRGYAIIGSVTINAERNQSMKEILEKMRYEAAQLGADAITNIRTNAGTGTWARIKPRLFKNSHVRANFIADAIVFK